MKVVNEILEGLLNYEIRRHNRHGRGLAVICFRAADRPEPIEAVRTWLSEEVRDTDFLCHLNSPRNHIVILVEVDQDGVKAFVERFKKNQYHCMVGVTHIHPKQRTNEDAKQLIYSSQLKAGL